MTPRVAGVAAALLVLLNTLACDPCAGTPSCHTDPEISYTGQFIEFPSGRKVSGVEVAFVRSGGVALLHDQIRATSDADGFFVLRTGAIDDGVAIGDLIVTPPPPNGSYTVRGIHLETHTKRGDGGFLGRLMVNPYLQFIGELHDLETFAVVPGGSITIRQFGPGVVEPAITQTTAAENGRFMWEPKVVSFGDLLEVEYEITAPGYARSYQIRDTIRLQYRDEPPQLKAILVGDGFLYFGVVRRRGTKQTIPGVTVSFVRTGGITVTPDQFTATPDQNGGFRFPISTSAQGTMIGDLTIHPPAPLPPETHSAVALATLDGGKGKVLSFDYGPATILRPVLVYRATGLPIEAGTHARFTHVGGLADVTPAPWGVPIDSGIRIVDSIGVVGYDAATSDTGTVLYDVEVRLNEPHDWEMLRAIPIPAQRSDTPFQDTLRVGRWFPWIGELRDAVTDSPVAGASVRFQRVSGAFVRPASFTVVSGPDGKFPIQPVPITRKAVGATLRVTLAGYRDTVVSVQLQPTQDDTIRSIGVVRLTRAQP